MTPAWAQRQEELLRGCLVSPNVFGPMVDRLGQFVVPCQQAIEAGQHHAHRYLAGLLSHLTGARDARIMGIEPICCHREDGEVPLHPVHGLLPPLLRRRRGRLARLSAPGAAFDGNLTAL